MSLHIWLCSDTQQLNKTSILFIFIYCFILKIQFSTRNTLHLHTNHVYFIAGTHQYAYFVKILLRIIIRFNVPLGMCVQYSYDRTNYKSYVLSCEFVKNNKIICVLLLPTANVLTKKYVHWFRYGTHVVCLQQM